ncbi:hypothetical protein ACHAWC_009539 [Mediolabrus comicus]
MMFVDEHIYSLVRLSIFALIISPFLIVGVTTRHVRRLQQEADNVSIDFTTSNSPSESITDESDSMERGEATNDARKRNKPQDGDDERIAKRSNKNNAGNSSGTDDNGATFEDIPVTFAPMDEINLEVDGQVFKETSWEDVDTGDVEFRGDLFPLYTRGTKEDKELAGEVIGEYYVWLLFFHPMIGCAAVTVQFIMTMMLALIHSGNVFVIFFSREAASSGRSWVRLRDIILAYEYFHILVAPIQAMYRIGRGFIVWNLSGYHAWHFDKFLEYCDFRAILSLLCSTKIMWFTNIRTGAMFGIKVPHGAFIVLTRVGSGVVGPLRHMVTGAKGSFIAVFEFGKK